jgi:hypothetical protein
MLAGVLVEIQTENICTLTCLTGGGESHRARLSLDKTLHVVGHSPQVGLTWASHFQVASRVGVTGPTLELFLEPDVSVQTSPSVKVAATEIRTLAADLGSIPGNGVGNSSFHCSTMKGLSITCFTIQQMGRIFGTHGDHVKANTKR